MNITTNYQFNYLNLRTKANNQQLQTNPNFGNKQNLLKTVAPATMLTATAVLAMLGIANPKDEGIKTEQTKWGEIIYIPSKSSDTNAKLIVIRNNGSEENVFENISKEKLQSPVTEHVRQVNASTINPAVGIELVQNESKPVTAQKVILKGTLENSLVKNNLTGVPAQYSDMQDLMFIDTPWSPGIQYITGKCFMVTYGTVKEDWGALKDYCQKYANRETGEAPDVAILASQKGTEDRSFMPADIAGKQYEIVITNEKGEIIKRTPCNYDEMLDGVEYKISKKGGVILKMAVPTTDVISSEGETLKAGKLYMVDSNGHFYNGNPVKRIKSGEVTWNADMDDPVQAQIRNDIDESLRLEKEAKAIKKEAGNFDKQANELRKTANKKDNVRTLKDLNKHNAYAAKLNKNADELAAKADALKAKANELNAQAKQLTVKAEKEMTDWVKTAQNKDGLNFFAE